MNVVVTGIFQLRSYCTLLNRLAATTERRIEFRTLSAPELLPFHQYVTDPLRDLSCLQYFDVFTDQERYMMQVVVGWASPAGSLKWCLSRFQHVHDRGPLLARRHREGLPASR